VFHTILANNSCTAILPSPLVHDGGTGGGGGGRIIDKDNNSGGWFLSMFNTGTALRFTADQFATSAAIRNSANVRQSWGRAGRALGRPLQPTLIVRARWRLPPT